jgi:hypothetical protein
VRPPRMQIWLMMIVIAAIALPMGFWARRLSRERLARQIALSESYRQRAAAHEKAARDHTRAWRGLRLELLRTRRAIEFAEAVHDSNRARYAKRVLASYTRDADETAGVARWHESLRAKYEKAATRPGDPLPPDPPKPAGTKPASRRLIGRTG